jgi:hypothetical protein
VGVTIDQGMDGSSGAGEVAVQQEAARLSRGGGSSEPCVAHVMKHCFQ